MNAMAPETSSSTKAEGDAPSATKSETKRHTQSSASQQQQPHPKGRSKLNQRQQPEGSGFLEIQIPRRISAGKSFSPNQMLLVFVGIFAVLLQMAYKLGNLMIQPDGSRKHHRILTSPVKRSEQRRELITQWLFGPIAEIMMKKQAAAEDRERNDPCNIYQGPSSIPDSGWGWFAGKNYTAGELIRIEYGFDLQVPPSVPGMSNGDIAPWTMLLKPHSILSNVEWDEDSSSSMPLLHEGWKSTILVATRDIRVGEEFFVSWEDHPYTPKSSPSLGNTAADSPLEYAFAESLPSPEHFVQADERIREARIQFFGAIDRAKIAEEKAKPTKSRYRNSDARFNRVYGHRNKRPSTSPQLYKKESAPEIEAGLTLWKRTIEEHDPLVAKLLPTKVRTLAMFHNRVIEDESLFSSSSLLGSLHNQTKKSLRKTAQCLSNLEWKLITKPSDIENTQTEVEDGGVTETCERKESYSFSSRFQQVVTRQLGFTKGETVGVVQLLLMRHDHTQDHSILNVNGRGSCLPLPSSMPVQELMLCPLGGIYDRSFDSDLANVEYQWSNSSTFKDIPLSVKSLLLQSNSSSPLSSEEQKQQSEILFKTFQKYSLLLSWDIVALRDIQQNETVVLYQPDEQILPANIRVDAQSEADEKTK